MKDYTIVIAYSSLSIGLFVGLVKWIESISSALQYGETFSFLAQLFLFEILIPIFGFTAWVSSFLILFIVCLPLLGIYKLITR